MFLSLEIVYKTSFIKRNILSNRALIDVQLQYIHTHTSNKRPANRAHQWIRLFRPEYGLHHHFAHTQYFLIALYSFVCPASVCPQCHMPHCPSTTAICVHYSYEFIYFICVSHYIGIWPLGMRYGYGTLFIIDSIAVCVCPQAERALFFISIETFNHLFYHRHRIRRVSLCIGHIS